MEAAAPTDGAADEQPGAPRTAGPRVVPALERATYVAERPLRRLVGANRLNPLPHAGTISVFLLVVVVVSGVYITLFFSYGFEASYRSVERMRDHPIQSVVRSVHRYSSAALVLTTLIHAWRIFVAGRFRGPRRWRWTTGVAALLVVWLAGVTGYWLVWDQRAQALNDATLAVAGGWERVSTFFLRDVVGSGAGSGWGVMFTMWVLHLLLTVVIAWFAWRHVRRSRLAVLPPRHWMAAMLAALVLVAVVLPADLLGPADPSRLVDDMPVDPFVLFLLPPLIEGWGWPVIAVLAAAVTAALAAPHLARRPTPVVEIDAERCTGCELCVIDCPYLALDMVDRTVADAADGVQPRHPLAVVDADACVGCGICVGACSFGAMHLPGSVPLDGHADSLDPAGKHVVVACRRHVETTGLAHGAVGGAGEGHVVVEVACSGMVHANAIGALMRNGATGVQVVGCAAGDCAYGLGNTILHERLAGTRAPHVPRRYAGVAAEDWVAPTELVRALSSPGEHSATDVTSVPHGRRFVAAGAVVVGSVVAVGLATRAPFRSGNDEAVVRVLVDHTPGARLEGQAAAADYTGGPLVLVVSAGGDEIRRESLSIDRGFAAEIVDVELDPTRVAEPVEIDVELIEGAAAPIGLFSATVELEPGRRLTVEAVDVPAPPGIAEGKRVFAARDLGACDVCHSTRPGDDGVGPSLAGVGTRAATRVAELDADEYLRESILDPAAHVVDGYRGDQMLPIYEERLSPEQIDALVAYLRSLTADPGDDS